MMPKVSVVVATYRREQSLKDALESLAGQTYTDFEIVVVDDNGEKEWNLKVEKIVDDFRGRHKDIFVKLVINNRNQGSAMARNIGIDTSRGEFVTFLDDDDLYLPEKVGRQVVFMQECGCDYSITDLVLYNENEKLTDKRVRNYIRETSPQTLLEYHLKYHITGTDTMMFKKDYLTKISGFAPIDVGDEFYLMQRAIEGKGKFGYLKRCDVKAYIHTGDAGLSSGDSKIDGENALYEYKRTFFDDVDKKTRRYIKMRHFAVIAFAELRRGRYVAFLKNALMSFFAAPVACVGLFFGSFV